MEFLKRLQEKCQYGASCQIIDIIIDCLIVMTSHHNHDSSLLTKIWYYRDLNGFIIPDIEERNEIISMTKKDIFDAQTWDFLIKILNTHFSDKIVNPMFVSFKKNLPSNLTHLALYIYVTNILASESIKDELLNNNLGWQKGKHEYFSVILLDEIRNLK